jgi:hypothetical protein
MQHAVWLYYRFNLSIRNVEDLLAERNIPLVTKLFDSGSTNLAPSLPNDFAADTPASATPTFWTKCSQRSEANNITFGALLTKTAKS